MAKFRILYQISNSTEFLLINNTRLERPRVPLACWRLRYVNQMYQIEISDYKVSVLFDDHSFFPTFVKVRLTDHGVALFSDLLQSSRII